MCTCDHEIRDGGGVALAEKDDRRCIIGTAEIDPPSCGKMGYRAAVRKLGSQRVNETNSSLCEI